MRPRRLPRRTVAAASVALGLIPVSAAADGPVEADGYPACCAHAVEQYGPEGATLPGLVVECAKR